MPTYETIQAIALAFGCPPGLKGDTLLLKTPHTLEKSVGTDKQAFFPLVSFSRPGGTVEQPYPVVNTESFKNDQYGDNQLWI